MAEQNPQPKKRGRKKRMTSSPAPTAVKRIPRNLENLDFEQLQELNSSINELMKTKKEEQIRKLRAKLAELEKM
jgi:hypothetical protein